MPKFYFDVTDGGEFRDPHGTELADYPTAQQEAFRILCQMLPIRGVHVLESGIFTITVSDHDRAHLMTLELSAHLGPAPSQT